MAFQPDRNLYSYKLLHGILICFPLKRNKNNASNKNHHYDSMFFYVIMQIFSLLQDNAKHYFLCLESAKTLFAFRGLDCDLKYNWKYLFLFSIQNIQGNCKVVFLKCFPVALF